MGSTRDNAVRRERQRAAGKCERGTCQKPQVKGTYCAEHFEYWEKARLKRRFAKRSVPQLCEERDRYVYLLDFIIAELETRG